MMLMTVMTDAKSISDAKMPLSAGRNEIGSAKLDVLPAGGDPAGISPSDKSRDNNGLIVCCVQGCRDLIA